MRAVKEGDVGVVNVGEEKEESGLAPEMEVHARRKAESLLEKCSCEVKKELLVLLVKEETDNVGNVERVVNSGTRAKVSDIVFDSVPTVDLVEVVIKPRAVAIVWPRGSLVVTMVLGQKIRLVNQVAVVRQELVGHLEEKWNARKG